MECMDRMYLLSDSNPTLGIPCEEIVESIRGKWTSNNPTLVPITAIAVGELANGKLLQMPLREDQGDVEVVTEDVGSGSRPSWEEVSVTFQPGPVGMTADWRVGVALVTAVKPAGQAHEQGVHVGWKILTIDDKPYKGEAHIDRKIESKKSYNVTFNTPPKECDNDAACVEHFPGEKEKCVSGVCKECDKDAACVEKYPGEKEQGECISGVCADASEPQYPTFHRRRRRCMDGFMQKLASTTDGEFINGRAP